ncbi:hypothetical protein [Nonomuraea angiospora]
MATRFDLTTTAGMMSAIHHLTGHLNTGRVTITVTDADYDEGTHAVLVRFIGLDLDDDGKPTLFIRGSAPGLTVQDTLTCCVDRPDEPDDGADSELMARWTGASVELTLPDASLTLEEAHHLRKQLGDAIRAASGPDQCEAST